MNKATAPQLLACPFCKSTNVQYEKIESEPEVGFHFPEWTVECQKCDARGPIGGSLETGKVKAGNDWNRAKR